MLCCAKSLWELLHSFTSFLRIHPLYSSESTHFTSQNPVRLRNSTGSIPLSSASMSCSCSGVLWSYKHLRALTHARTYVLRDTQAHARARAHTHTYQCNSHRLISAMDSGSRVMSRTHDSSCTMRRCTLELDSGSFVSQLLQVSYLLGARLRTQYLECSAYSEAT